MGVELAGHRRRIGGQADDGLAALARREIRYGDPFDLGFGAHLRASFGLFGWPHSVPKWCSAQYSFGGNRKALPGPQPAYKQPAMRSITMRPEAHKRFTTGHPWVYSNEIVMDAAAKAIEPGSVVRLLRADGSALALALFNPHTLIAARRLTDDHGAKIEAEFFAERLERALKLRD